MKFELHEADSVRDPGMPVIKVVGLGGGGGNAVDYMVRNHVEGVDFIVANTDAQALNSLQAPIKIQLGKSGLGAGARPDKGREAAREALDEIREQLRNADMVFITAGMGGGTGTGAAPVVAQIAREMGILTVGVVSKPFKFERRDKVAEQGIAELRDQVDSLIVVPNDKLIQVLGGDFLMVKAFDYANEVLHGAVQGIAELITRPGLINVDFEDVRTVMSQQGYALMGVGAATGENRARAAAEKAIRNPLLEDVNVKGARGVLVNVTAGMDFTMQEWEEVGKLVEEVAGPDSEVIVGTSIDPNMENELRVTVVATGLEYIGQQAAPQARRTRPQPQPDRAEQAEPEAASNKPEYDLKPTGAPEPGVARMKPAVAEPEPVRNVQPQRAARVANGPNEGFISPTDILDIPTFLRRQAD
ncbi:cell division protein FtsZ [Sulfurivirga caldicuralii]|uniref:Cell division protein FtsZ n=1 Tax=Sulfurivirga caldicuralii TaxID=364032 RepID=A0A1N6DVI8_9GAMM|nr:cell division protein FtsZ [Sulfurivirga caldicuralii]SIN74704.1 cell division protein FtsZ [Sulfurivirga caldicuralii]